MRINFISFITVFLGPLCLAFPAVAQSGSEICEQIYLQYGVASELCGGSAQTAPAVPKDPEPNLEFKENHISFAQGGTQLSVDATAQLTVLAQIFDLPVMQNVCIKLTGHSDTSGTESQNHAIAQSRAETVAAYLQTRLEDETRIVEITSAGETDPLADYAGSSPINRRVAIFVRDCQ